MKCKGKADCEAPPSLIEHHISSLLGSDLPDLSLIKHSISDYSDNLGDILNSIEHLVESKTVNLPT